MADYTYNDMLRMQKEAAERVRQMKKRATIITEDETESKRNVPLPDDVRHYSMPVEFEKKESEAVSSPVQTTRKRSSIGKITDDRDALIILAVLSVLSKEKTDYLIILALIYILM